MRKRCVNETAVQLCLPLQFLRGASTGPGADLRGASRKASGIKDSNCRACCSELRVTDSSSDLSEYDFQSSCLEETFSINALKTTC